MTSSPASPQSEVLTRQYAQRNLHPERLQAILAHAGTSILDAGCGNGAYVLTLADRYRIRGIDWQPFESWQQRPELFRVGNVTQLEEPDASVETVTAFEVLEHLPDPLAVLRDFHRICSKNLILTVPNCEITPGMRASLVTYHHYIDPTHVNFFTLDSIAQICEQAGFRVRQRGYINQMNLLPLIYEAYDLSGLFGRILGRLLRRRQKRVYRLTCLIVADKA